MHTARRQRAQGACTSFVVFVAGPRTPTQRFALSSRTRLFIGANKNGRVAPAVFTHASPRYLRCDEMSFVISNIVTFALPSTCLSFSSALIMRLFTASCSLFFLM